MSEILIKGMEMPKNGFITITVTSGGRVVGNSKKENGKFEYLDNEDIAKAVPVPPHGDLIDRNEMFVEFVIEGQKSTRYKVGEKWELNGEEVRRVIQRLPSVIPAEEPKEET